MRESSSARLELLGNKVREEWIKGMQIQSVERVRGVGDVLPDEAAALRAIAGQLRGQFELFGYRPVDVPVLEHTELYLRKFGDAVVARLYEFQYRGRRLALRPEFTASIIRAYNDGLQHEPLPVRLYHEGPVFRYEKPQRGRFRQFSQMGVDLIGAAGPMADAEVIALACQALDRLGVARYRVVIGHIGLLAAFLDRLALEPRVRGYLLTHMEALRKQSIEANRVQLAALFPSVAGNGINLRPGRELLREMAEPEARAMLTMVLETLHVEVEGARAPDEILDRLLSKMKRGEQSGQLRQALEFIHRLGALAGSPQEVFAGAAALLDTYPLDRTPLEQLRRLMETLRHYGIAEGSVTFDLGLSRGLHYYTGMIFEIYHGEGEEAQQLCGGGRYDGLTATLGGKAGIPAAGFSFGVERLQMALDPCTHEARRVPFVVVPLTAAEESYAIRVAGLLRAEGLRVELSIRGAGVKRALHSAHRRAIPVAVLAGRREVEAEEVVVKQMETGEEKRVALTALARTLREGSDR